MAKKYALQPEGYSLFFRCPNKDNLSPSGIWSPDPEVALCYGREPEYSDIAYLLITNETPNIHGNGFNFATDLDSLKKIIIPDERFTTFRRVSFFAIYNIARRESHLLFETDQEILPPFLEYLVELNHIKKAPEIIKFISPHY